MEYLRKALELLNSKKALFTTIVSLGAILLSSAIYYLGLKTIIFSLFFLGILSSAVYLSYLYIKTGKNPRPVDLFNHYLKERVKQLKHIGVKRFAWKKSPFSHLPWFIFLGMPASGKTSLLKKSAIHFPALESKDAVDNEQLKETEQTAHCDWWFANHAVFIDTAGWYMTGSPAKSHWQLLLKRIKTLKRHQALNGIVLTVNYKTLETKKAAQDFEQLRARIEDLYQQIGYLLPVHLVITHCDLIPGFESFFASLDEPSKEQVWGISLISNAGSEQALVTGMDGLYQRLNARLYHQLHLQEDKQQKIAQLRFPQQFIRLKSKLLRLVNEMAKDNIYQEKFNLAGVYFTASDEQEDSQKGYFSHDLLEKRFIESGLNAPYSHNKQKQLKHQHYAMWVGLTAGFLLTMTLFVKAFSYNINLLKAGDNLVASMVMQVKKPQSSQEKLVFLNAAGEHFQKLSEFQHMEPWYHKLGMSRVNSQKQIYQQFLAKALDHEFYFLVKKELAKELLHYHQQWKTASSSERETMRGDYYADLKAYLMLNFPQHIDLSFAGQHLANKWRGLYVSDSQTENLRKDSFLLLSRFYLNYLSGLDKDKRSHLINYQAGLIAGARGDLSTRSGVSNWYAQLSQQLNKQSGRLSLDQFFDDTVGADLLFSESHIPVFYTRKGYVQNVKPAFVQLAKSHPRQDWVIHSSLERIAKTKPSDLQVKISPAQQIKIFHELNALYYQHYLDNWVHFIGSVKLAHFNSLDDASQQLRAVYQPESAYSQLFKTLHDNLALSEFVDKDSYQFIPEHLRQPFKELEQLTDSYKAPNALLEQYNKQLMLLQQDIERLSIGSELAVSAEHYVSSLLMTKGQDTEVYKTSLVVDNLTNQLNGLSSRQAVKSLLLSPVQETYRALLVETMQGLQTEWQKSIYQLYQDRLAQRFPFNPRGQDANLADVIDFYKPQHGLLASFMNERIYPFMQFQGHRFVLKSWLGVEPPFNPLFLNWLVRQKAMSQALFPDDTNELKVRFAIYPMPTPGVKEILFVSNGQSYPYRNGPQEWVNFTWPGQDTMDNESFIRITQSFADAQSAKEYQGVWGLFHLLHAASNVVKLDRGYKLGWRFNQGGHKTIQMLIGSKTSTNPFEALLFKPQPIPERLMG